MAALAVHACLSMMKSSAPAGTTSEWWQACTERRGNSIGWYNRLPLTSRQCCLILSTFAGLVATVIHSLEVPLVDHRAHVGTGNRMRSHFEPDGVDGLVAGLNNAYVSIVYRIHTPSLYRDISKIKVLCATP